MYLQLELADLPLQIDALLCLGIQLCLEALRSSGAKSDGRRRQSRQSEAREGRARLSKAELEGAGLAQVRDTLTTLSTTTH